MRSASSPIRSRSVTSLPQREDHAQILADRLAEREEVDDLLVRLDVEEVHDVIAGDHVAGGLQVRLAQRRHRLRDLILHQAAHAQHHAVQVRQLLIEALEGVLFAAHRGRPAVALATFSRTVR